MSNITFNAIGIDMPQFNEEAVSLWIEAVARTFDKSVGALAYIFCNDEKILEVNREFLQHDYYTDIITFDYSSRRRIAGDMFISLDTVRSNAEMLGKRYDEELMRVVIHGVLHLVGINDKGPGEREIMERHEDEALALLGDLGITIQH
ncbi:MAG: rRNA maturation RNase YbeY [Muribaculaceae bacterium]